VIANQWVLMWLSVVLAVIVVLLARLPRPVLVIVVGGAIGAVLGVAALSGRTSVAICDFATPSAADTCGGLYVSDHRLPQFMQGPHADAWLTITAAVAGVLVVDLIALGAMWTLRRVRRNQRVPRTA
jgi:hypothetical protein